MRPQPPSSERDADLNRGDARQAVAPLVERPQLLRARASRDVVDGGRYSRVFALSGPPMAILLQQVATEIRFTRGEHELLGYRGCYLEYFRLDDQGQALDDTHDLVLRRDGWDLAAVRRLLRRHRLDHTSSSESRLRCVKTFTLGLGAVEDAPVHLEREGRSFGFLAEGPSPIEAQVSVAAADGSGRRAILPDTPCPFGYAPAGRGSFVDAQGWVAREVFEYRYTTRTGRFNGEGYLPTSLATLLTDPAERSEA